jgi:UDP-glucose 4-epimerase
MTAIERLLDVQLTIKWGAARPLDVPFSIIAIDRAAGSLGWKPKTTFETGLAITIDWARRYRSEIDKIFL